MTIGSHQSTVGKSQVHLTPRWIVDALGPFDLDPCAATVRPWDCATRNFIEADDGLSQPWTGRVWLNPPFNRYGVDRWMQRMADHGNGIALLHARTETAWFARAWEHADALLFVGHRIIFVKPDGSQQTTSKGQVANSGAPVVLVAFGGTNVAKLHTCGIRGRFTQSWQEVGRAA